ncbi:SDR family NAD(P)-dependent oxidoreductase [Streptococcus sp. zg-JUN1979]|uniref:SDR family NAD(P)-dependent oxidoreductase n=1 Tax=Streptococcus sp. zg-JUN1979 TaxID=3391450 RepID=UPI0039AF61AA
MTKDKVLVVTGGSKGIGFEIAVAALKVGYKVAATSRNGEALADKIVALVPEKKDQFLSLTMAFDETSIQTAMSEVVATFGQINVLVNNAGYALLGAVEEVSMAGVRANFDVNVFGLLQVTQAVLPYMREKRSGHMINLASISGTVTGPTQGIYSATKAAVIMMSEALSDEVAPLGIQVTAICPGGIRTDFLDKSSLKKPAHAIKDYEIVHETLAQLDRLNHNQSGDPKKVALAILEVADMAQAPKRLYLNRSAVAGVRAKALSVLSEVEDHLDLSLSTDS